MLKLIDCVILLFVRSLDCRMVWYAQVSGLVGRKVIGAVKDSSRSLTMIERVFKGGCRVVVLRCEIVDSWVTVQLGRALVSSVNLALKVPDASVQLHCAGRQSAKLPLTLDATFWTSAKRGPEGELALIHMLECSQRNVDVTNGSTTTSIWSMKFRKCCVKILC